MYFSENKMKNNKDNIKSIQNKLAVMKYNCSETTHLTVESETCKKCKDKTCTYICPANVYSVDEATGEIMVSYENCLECGACRIACPKKKLEWRYPCAGCGVVLKHS